MLRILAATGLISLLLMTSVGCTSSSSTSPDEVAALLDRIMASPSTTSLSVNTTRQLNISAVYVKGSGGSIKDVTDNSTYESSDSTITIVSKEGILTGIAAGSVNITVSFTHGEETRTIEIPVTVRPPAPRQDVRVR
jgi:YbbR domain-containing protein|tara:strand:+ start:50 stop:460 length:411 start_codon:yes stop_codon:yes gene_type:complete